MATRTRVRNPATDVGTLTQSDGVTVWDRRTFSLAGYSICTDTVAPGNGHPFAVNVITSKSGGIINGDFTSGSKARNYCLSACSGKDAFLGFASRSQLGLSSDAWYAAKLVADTNPSRADVDIPVFIAELKDLPGLVASAGGKLIKQIAKNNLKYQYGIRPLVSDLSSMLNFVESTEARLKELRALAKTGLRRTRNLGSGSYVERFTQTLNSTFGIVVKGDVTRTTRSRVWGHVEWRPSAGFPKTDASLLATARRAVFGLTVDAATAWELIPFSWLVDWYGSIGNYLQATRNIVPCTHSIPLIMSHRDVEVLAMPQSLRTITSNYHMKGYLGYRSPTPVTATAGRLPCLSARQLSILASLIILRAGKY